MEKNNPPSQQHSGVEAAIISLESAIEIALSVAIPRLRFVEFMDLVKIIWEEKSDEKYGLLIREVGEEEFFQLEKKTDL